MSADFIIFVFTLLDNIAKYFVEKFGDENLRNKAIFTLWDAALKGAYKEFSEEIWEFLHDDESLKFGTCSLEIYYAREYYRGTVGDSVVYLAAPTKIDNFFSQDGHWMNVTLDGKWFMDGFGNWIYSKKVGEKVVLNGKEFYVARICNIDEIAPNLGVEWCMSQIYRFYYYLIDNGMW